MTNMLTRALINKENWKLVSSVKTSIEVMRSKSEFYGSESRKRRATSVVYG